jgi:hypothetical protein
MSFYDHMRDALKLKDIPNMTKDELYEKYSHYGVPLNNARLYYCLENRLDIKYIKELIELGVDLEYYDDEHKFPLWEAIKHKNDIEVVKALKEAYYDDCDLLECYFFNHNIGCVCCESEYNPDNEENFRVYFDGSIIEYLHMLYFKDDEYLKYFELFNCGPITDIKDIEQSDRIREFYETYLKFSYMKHKHENDDDGDDDDNIIDISGTSDIDQKYPEYIDYKQKSSSSLYEYYLLHNNIIHSIISNDIESYKLYSNNPRYDGNIYKGSDYFTQSIVIAINYKVDLDLFKYIWKTHGPIDIMFDKDIWNNKETVSDLYIYNIQYIMDLLIVLYNVYKEDIYKEYYNIVYESLK